MLSLIFVSQNRALCGSLHIIHSSWKLSIKLSSILCPCYYPEIEAKGVLLVGEMLMSLKVGSVLLVGNALGSWAYPGSTQRQDWYHQTLMWQGGQCFSSVSHFSHFGFPSSPRFFQAEGKREGTRLPQTLTPANLRKTTLSKSSHSFPNLLLHNFSQFSLLPPLSHPFFPSSAQTCKHLETVPVSLPVILFGYGAFKKSFYDLQRISVNVRCGSS